MGDNASLDDFLGGESSEQAEAADAGESPDETESAAEAEPSEAAEQEPADDGTETAAANVGPAKTTYAWSDEGTTCEACGEAVERRWQQAGELVCTECKDWEQP